MIDNLPTPLRPFAFHGVVFEKTSGDDWLADCPFCGKSSALSVNSETGRWVCHSKRSRCGRSGNAVTFLSQLAAEAHERTTEENWESLSEARGLPPEAFARWGVGYWEQTDKWLVPVANADGAVVDLKTWSPGRKLLSTAGMKSGMWGSAQVAGADKVWLCEGEWDGMAMAWLLDNGGGDGVAAALPGARTFKTAWADLLRGKKIVVCGDNDEDGDAMAEKVWRELGGVGVEFVNWPDSLPLKYDVRDFVSARTRRPKAALRELSTLVSDRQRRMPFPGQDDVVAATTGVRASQKKGRGASLEQTLKIYGDHLEMTEDLRLALVALYAVQMSTQWPGDPLWMFLVGAPGSGKTELLLSLADSPDTVYQSSVDSRSLCSGFKTRTDPSLIPRIIGKCAVFKDWTELLESHPTELQKTYGVLRGTYDGLVDRPYGNGIVRKYVGTFHLLAGVTNKIHAHSTATVGERFLKFQLRRPTAKTRDEVVWTAMMGVTREKEKNEALRAAAARFLDRRAEPPDPRRCAGEEYARRIRAIACLVAAVRSDVTWQTVGYEREVAFRPDVELPTRLAKQLMKLAMATCAVYGDARMGEREWEVVERVAMNTAYGYHMDVVEAAMRYGGKNVPSADLEETAGIPRFTLDRRVAGMAVLGLVRLCREKRAMGPGASQTTVTVSQNIRRWWGEAGIVQSHVEENVAAARTLQGYDRE